MQVLFVRIVHKHIYTESAIDHRNRTEQSLVAATAAHILFCRNGSEKEKSFSFRCSSYIYVVAVVVCDSVVVVIVDIVQHFPDYFECAVYSGVSGVCVRESAEQRGLIY